MIKAVIGPEQYGTNPYSVSTAKYRIENPRITPGQNIATFHLTRRRDMDDEGTVTDWLSPAEYPDRIITVPSLGMAFKQDVGIRGKTITLNTSHSEYQLYQNNQEFVALREAEIWPRYYVIDWVFTERPACGAKFHNWKVVAGGCERLLDHCEDQQSLRLWDRDKGGEWPYSNRPDAHITVHSMFDPSTATSDIKAAAAAYKKSLQK
ncbi:hypothetical protein [Streptosporangium sp. LJ11]|uniref:hypothetical protein n=1 Tax=Streptosporangium sp. LJ11 TaxID=3436927 RepID=UPI003F79988B